MNDSRIRRPLGRSLPQNSEQSREFFEEQVCADEGVHLLVMADNEPIGFTGLVSMSKDSGVAEVGYWIIPDYWGDGYATEATQLLVEYAFNQHRLHKLGAGVAAFNDASRQVLEKIGFVEEGIKREQVFVDGEHQDVHIYGLLEREWHSDESS